MLTLRVPEVAQALEVASPSGADAVEIRGVSTDSRSMAPGQLFFALSGPSFDAHAFLAQARVGGAAAAVVAHTMPDALPQIVVPDPRAALGVLARAWRERFTVPVIAVTGSNGKTTVKEMMASCFAAHASEPGAVLATPGNLNNDIGLPLTLFSQGQAHQYVVLEMGANHAGEIAGLAAIASPRIGIVTQCAPAHLEGFGSLEGVARAKGELFEALPADGTAVINADDPYAALWMALSRHTSQMTFGLSVNAHVTGRFVGEAGGSRIVADTPSGRMSVQLPLPGRHNVMNALGVTAACLSAGLALDSICEGLESMVPVAGRLRPREGIRGVRVLDDSYTANPVSLVAALDVLAQQPGRGWLVLGDMAELGCGGAQFHREAGLAARASGVERLYTLGEQSQLASEVFGADGRGFLDATALIAAVREDAASGVTILVKGSRSMRMERVVQGLTRAGDDVDREGAPCC